MILKEGRKIEEKVYLSEIVFDWHKQLFSFIDYLEQIDPIDIATLGPAGTSSETAAKYILRDLKNKYAKYSLYPTYEEAYHQVVEKAKTLLLVANAYEGIDKIYMSSKLNFLFSFPFETPYYGLAQAEDYQLPKDRTLKIATHHAPSSLIPWFMNGDQIDYKPVLVSSTSEAATMVKNKQVDLCVTNTTSAEKYNVKFISRMRPILMQWSLFGVTS